MYKGNPQEMAVCVGTRTFLSLLSERSLYTSCSSQTVPILHQVFVFWPICSSRSRNLRRLLCRQMCSSSSLLLYAVHSWQVLPLHFTKNMAVNFVLFTWSSTINCSLFGCCISSVFLSHHALVLDARQ